MSPLKCNKVESNIIIDTECLNHEVDFLFFMLEYALRNIL